MHPPLTLSPSSYEGSLKLVIYSTIVLQAVAVALGEARFFHSNRHDCGISMSGLVFDTEHLPLDKKLLIKEKKFVINLIQLYLIIAQYMSCEHAIVLYLN